MSVKQGHIHFSVISSQHTRLLGNTSIIFRADLFQRLPCKVCYLYTSRSTHCNIHFGTINQHIIGRQVFRFRIIIIQRRIIRVHFPGIQYINTCRFLFPGNFRLRIVIITTRNKRHCHQCTQGRNKQKLFLFHKINI